MITFKTYTKFILYIVHLFQFKYYQLVPSLTFSKNRWKLRVIGFVTYDIYTETEVKTIESVQAYSIS